MTTLEVVMEAARPLTFGQLEGLGALAGQVIVPLQAARPSWLSASVVVQLSMVVAT